jgi:defect in organelle trafficking protein DotC
VNCKHLKLVIIAATVIVSPCLSAHSRGALNLQAYLGFIKVNQLPVGQTGINPMRLKAINETATELGARGALAYRSIQINHTLQEESHVLDGIFNFNRLLLPHNVLPPVLQTSKNSMVIDNSNTVRGDAKTYALIKPARFVTTAPTWRTYLWMNYSAPPMPNKILLPTTQTEATAWNNSIAIGWHQGLEQANNIFNLNLNRLKRDINGMILYKRLLAQHMISAPYVSSSKLGITGNSQQLRINDYVKRITDPAQLQPNSKKWSALLTDQSNNCRTAQCRAAIAKANVPDLEPSK